jgi:hypothetical protein
VTTVTVRTVSGVATFTDLGFISSVGVGARELTFTSDAFLATTLTISPSHVAATVNITSSGQTNGVFVNGNFESSTDGTANILNTDLVSAMTQGSVLVESFGDITVVNGFTSSASGSDLSLKARGSISVNASQTIRTNGGDVIIWSDSDVSGGGVIRLLNSSEICTISATCGTATTGGGDIVLAGGAASSADAARPGGFAAGFGTTSNNAGTSTMTGVQIGTQQQAGQGARLYSAGGQITIRGAGATANSTDRPTALDVLAASVINSGAGQIQIDAEYRSSNAGQRTIEFSAWGSGTTTIASTNSSSSAVVIRSSTAAGAAAGNLGISANTTVFNVTGGLVFEAERINKSLNFTFNVAGPLVFRPYATTLLNESATTSFELPSSIAFTSNPSSITVGSSTNTSPILISESLQTTSGNIELLTSGAISKTTSTLTAAGEVAINSRSGSVSTGSGAISATSVRIEAGTTVALEGNITAGASGTLVRSGGRITGSAGASAANPLSISTRGGPITFWTTGTTGGVTLGNFTQLNTTQSSATGADITIGGGTAMTSDATRPSGAAASTAEHGIQLGTTVNSSVFVVRAGTGAFSASGSYTGTASTVKAGIWLPPGQDINAGTISLDGTTTYNVVDDRTTGIDAFFSGSSATSLIHATRSFAVSGDSIRITGSSASNTGLSLGPNIDNPNPMTIRASGQNAGISITGTTSSLSATSGLWIAGVQLQTANGPVSLNSGARPIGLSSANRISSYAPISPSTGGNIRIVAGGIHSSSSSAAFNVNTAGTLTFEPFSTSFLSTVTFPATASTTTVGNLIVGTSGNTADLTVGAAVTSASEVTYRGGSITVSGNVSSTNGSVGFYSTGASKNFSKTSATITAAQDVIISSAASTVSTGTGAISAGTVRLSSSSTMTSGAPITSRGTVEISSSAGDTTVSGATTAAGDYSVVGGAVAVNAAQTTTNSRNITISPRTAYTGSGTLNSSGTITISGGSSVGPTNAIQATGNISVSGSGNFTNSGASITSSSGNVSITTSGVATAVVSANVQATTGSIAFSVGGAYSGAGTLTAGTTAAVTAAGVTVSGAVLAGGNVNYTSTGSLIQNANVTSSTGNVTMSISGASATYTKGTSNLTAAQEVSITSAASTVNTTGTGTISAGTVRLTSSTGMTSAAAITSRGIVEISNTTGTATVSATTNAAGNLTISSPTVVVSATQTTTNSGNITITPNGGAYSGAGQLNSAGSITISGGTNVDPTPTGAIQAVSNIVLRGSGQITTGASTTLTSSGGSVDVRTTGGLVILSNAVLASDSITVVLTGAYSGAGTLTATNGTVTISGGTSVAPTGAIRALGNISLSGSAAVSNSTAPLTSTSGAVSVTSSGTTVNMSGAISASTSVTLRANTELTTSAAITSSTSRVSITSTTTSVSVGSSVSGTEITVTPKTSYSGAGSLTASAGTITISGGTTVNPTGAIVATGNIAISGSARATMEARVESTGGAVSITGGTQASTDGGLYFITGSVITNTGAITLTGNASASWGAYFEGGSTISSNSGNITIAGNAPSSVWGIYVRGAKILSSSGAIRIDGGSSAGLVMGYLGTSDIASEPTGTVSSSSVTLVGNVYWDGSTGVRIRTAGPVVIESTATQFTGATTIANHTFTGNSTLRLGKLTNQSAVTVSGGSASIVNDYNIYGGAVTQNAAVTSSAGSIFMNPTGAYAGSGALTAAAGAVRISGGTSVAPTGALTALGDITLSGSAALSNSGASLTSTAGSIALTSTASTVTISAALSAPVNVTLTANTALSTSAAVSATSGTVTARSTTSSVALGAATSGRFVEVNPATTYTGAGALTASAGTVRITGGTSINTTGAVQATSNVVLRGSGDITTSSSATLTSSGGTVDVTSSSGSVFLYVDATAAASSPSTVGVLAKAANRVYLGSSADMTTSGSGIVLWADSDNSGVGDIELAGTNVLRSAGGRITMAGGLDNGAITNTEFVGRTAGDGHPDNYAAGTTDTYVGVLLRGGHQILSSGGEVFIAGIGAATTTGGDIGVGIMGGLVYSATGKIQIYGKSPTSCANDWHRGILTGWNGRTHIVSESQAEDAIYLYGNTATCNNGWSVYASAVQGYNSYTDIVAPNGGGIKIYGIQGNASYYEGDYNAATAESSDILQLNYFNLVANSGPIHVQAVKATTSDRFNLRFATRGSNRSHLGQIATQVATGFSGYPTIASVASSSNVTLKADSIVPFLTTFNTTGNVSLIPNTTFESVVKHWFSGTWGTEFPKKMASFTVGAAASGATPQSSSDLDLSAISVSGPINLFGGAITQQGTWSSDQDVSISATKDVTIGYAVSAGDAGVIQTTGGDITFNAGVTAGVGGISSTASRDILVNASTTAGAGGLSFKAGRDVLVNTATKSITTSSAGNIVFWANSSGTGGEVDTGGSNVTINSSGGDIVVAGGADDGANGGTSADGIPDNFLLGRTWNHTARLNASMTSGNGDILVRSQAASGSTASAMSALQVNAGVQITASSGTIRFDARQNSGNTSASNQYSIWLGTGGARAVIRSATGNVILNGDASLSNRAQRRGIILYGVDIAATTGNVELNGISPGTTASFDVLGWDTSTVTAGGNILVSGARTSGTEFITFNAGGTTTLTVGQLIGGDAGGDTSNAPSVATAFAGSGSVVIQPTSASFTAAQTLANVTIASTVTGLTVGKSGNTAAVTLPVAYSIAGDINVFSGAVAVNANQATTNSGSITITASGDYTGSGTLTSAGDVLISAAATTVGASMQASGDLDIVSTSLTVTRSLTATVGRIYLKSTDNIIVQAGSSTSSKTNIQAPSGDITLQSDSDGNNDGYIWIQNYSNISTGAGGGDILLSGGTNPTTGFATASSADGAHRPGLQLGAFTTAPGYAEGITLAAGTGDLTLRGRAVSNAAGRGVVVPLSSSDANKSSLTGTNITIIGESAGSDSWYGVEIGNVSSLTATNVRTIFNASGTLALNGTSSNFDGVGAWGNYEFIGNRITVTGSGPRRSAAMFSSATAPSSVVAGLGGFSFSATKSGTVVSDDATFQPGSFSSTGSVSLVFDASTSTVASLAVAVPMSVTNTDVTVRANSVSLTGSINAGTGSVKFEPHTSSRGVTAGTEVTGTLALSATELGAITASTLRLETGGDLTVTSNLTFTNKVSTLAIRAGGNVSAASNLSVVVANLGIEAGGNITWPGTGHNAAVIALNAGASGTISFGQSANYSVAAVDGIDPEFGFGTKLVLNSESRTNTVDRFMAVTFNPPPVVIIQDKFSNPLASNNQSASSFVVRATLVSVPSDGVVRSLDGATAVRIGGTHTFTNLRVMGGTGLVGISYTAERSNGTLLPDSQTSETSVRINYTIRAGEPASIQVAFSSTSTRAGLTDLSPTATLKDSTNGVLTTGEYKNATISLSITGTSGRIISGETSPTTDGVARFPNLVVAGTAGSNAYTLTFSVTFRNSSNVTQTVSRSELISITPGIASTLSINSSSQTVTNRAILSDLAITVLDDYGNPAASSFPTSINAAVNSGTTLRLTPTLSGTTTRSTDSNTSVATFSGLSLSGKVDTYTITFASGSLTSTSHTVRLTHGAASNLAVSAPTTAANDRNFDSNVVVDIVDADGNVVTSGAQSTQTISISADTTLTGTRAISATAGRATFTGLRMVGTVGVKVLTASITSPSNFSTPSNITLGFGDATRVSLTRQASGFVNRLDFSTQPVLSILDSSGNVVTNHSQSITVTRTAVDAGKPATLSGTRTVLPSSGVVTFTNLRLEGKVGEFDLTFESGSLSSTTQRVTLTHGAVETVVVTGATTTSNARTFGSAIRVEIHDVDANLVTTGTAGSQSIALSVSDATLSGTTTRSAVAGAADFSGLVLTGTTGAKTLTATILDPTAKTGTRTVTISHGAATQLVLTTSASQAVSRENLGVQPVIQVRDVSGNPVSDFVGRVSVAVSRASSGIPFSLTGTRVIDLNGSPTATFSSLGLYGEVGDFTLSYTGLDTAASQNLTSTSQSITLAHGTATNLVVTSPATARNAITLGSLITVEVRDEDNNRVTSSNEQITLSISDATISGTAQRNLSSGLATFSSLAFVGAEGAKTLTATLASPSLTKTAALTLEFGEATKLAISQAASGAVNRSNFSTQPIIQAQDVSGNVVDDYTTSVSIAVSRSASAVAFGLSGTGTLNASAGVATFTGLGLFGETGDYTLTYSSGSLTTTSQTLRMTHGVATQVKIIDGSTNVFNGATFSRSYATQIQDQDGNVVTTGSDATAIVTLTPSGATLTGTRSKASGSGTASFSGLVMTGVVGSKTITASTATFTSAPYAVTLNAGAATQLVLTTSATGAVNRVAFGTQPAITVQDSSGNTVSSYTTDVTVTSTPVDGSASATITGTLSRTPSTGIATFTNLRLEGKVGQHDLTFSSGSLSATTQRVTLSHGAVSSVVLSGAMTASNARTFGSSVTVEIQDADQNRVTTGSAASQSIVMTATGAQISGTTPRSATAGLATFNDLILTGTTGTKTITATILDPISRTGTRDVELSHGLATQLVLTTQATSATNRTTFGTQPVVSVRDVSGNPVSDFVGRV